MNILNNIASVTTTISNFIWPIFLPLLVAASIFISFVTISKITKTVEKTNELTLKKMIGPASISLGSKIGTGSIIGVLGSLNKLSSSNQGNIEGIVIWAFLGSFILIPLTYSETFISRTLDKSPTSYIKENVSKTASKFYAISLVILYVFGFGGFQFNGIDTVLTIATNKITAIELTEIQRYLFVIIPVIFIAAIIILSKKHNVFINAMSGMIGIAVVLYLLFFFIFLLKTIDYIPVFFNRAWLGFINPMSMGVGVPVGLIFGLQRIIQTSEAGLGTSPLASEEGKDMGAFNCALTQVIPTAITVVISLLITSYITSFGVQNGIITLPSDGIVRLQGFFTTAESITGVFGLIIISVFAILSGATTLLGSYFFLCQLFNNKNENRNIAIYMILIIVAGTLAIFGFNIVFDVVDILLFAVSGLNVLSLTIYVWKNHIKKKEIPDIYINERNA